MWTLKKAKGEEEKRCGGARIRDTKKSGSALEVPKASGEIMGLIS